MSKMPRGRKLVVQLVETFREKMQPTFVERLDAWQLQEDFGLELPPVMRELTESGVRVVLELGPGRSLAKLIGESQPEIVVRSVADFRSWPGVIDWLQARLRD